MARKTVGSDGKKCTASATPSVTAVKISVESEESVQEILIADGAAGEDGGSAAEVKISVESEESVQEVFLADGAAGEDGGSAAEVKISVESEESEQEILIAEGTAGEDGGGESAAAEGASLHEASQDKKSGVLGAVTELGNYIRTPEVMRLKEIITVFTKHSVLLSLAEQKHPEKVREAFEELGPTFIKIGQMLSVRTDIVSAEFAKEFEKLQNDVPADAYPVIKPVIEKDMGLPIEEVFECFEEEAMASASMAQIHRAVLKNGKRVVVKVQHPGIYESMTTDISLVEKALPLMKFIPGSAATDPAEIVAEIKYSLMNELDFTKESSNIEEFYRKNNGVGGIASPRVYREYTSARLLIMDYMEGDKISQYIIREDAEIEEGHKEEEEAKKRVADILLKNYMKQVFDDGFFHADPHPGNLLIQTADAQHPLSQIERSGGRLDLKVARVSMARTVEKPLPEQVVYIDFGMMGRLDDRIMEKFNRLFVAYFDQDTRKIAHAIISLCKRKESFEMDVFVADVGKLFDKYYTLEIGDMSFPEFFDDVIKICSDYKLQLPRELTMLAKGAGTLEGILKELDPNISTMTAIIPYAKRYMREQFDPEAELDNYFRNWARAGKALPQLPQKLLDVMDMGAKEKFTVNLVHRNLDDFSIKLEPLINRLVIGMIIAALIIGSSLLVNYEYGSTGNAVSTLGTAGYILAIVLAGALIYTTMLHKK